ncbi:MAG: hypothetical protein ACRD5R_10410 [Candidatus Acidiferrales bacterium]
MRENDFGKLYQPFPAARQMEMRRITHTYDNQIAASLNVANHFRPSPAA